MEGGVRRRQGAISRERATLFLLGPICKPRALQSDMGTIQERPTENVLSSQQHSGPTRHMLPDNEPSSQNEATQAPYCVSLKTELCWANTPGCVQETSFSSHLENSSMHAGGAGAGWGGCWLVCFLSKTLVETAIVTVTKIIIASTD